MSDAADRPRLTELRIKGMRTLEDVTLPLGGLTVLVGENGSGKSTIIEALEILRRSTEQGLTAALGGVHGLTDLLARSPHEPIVLGVSIQRDGAVTDYDLTVGDEDTAPRPQIAREKCATRLPEGRTVWFERIGYRSERAFAPLALQPDWSCTLFAQQGDAVSAFHPNVRAMRAAMRGIEVHVACATTPRWVSATLQTAAPARSATRLARLGPDWRVGLVGTDLASAVHELKNVRSQAWSETLDHLRLGLGHDLSDVLLPPDNSGCVSVSVVLGDRAVPAAALSDGQLAYFHMVVALRLVPRNRSLLALDEPDLHMHPGLVARLVSLIESAAEHTPVVVATQSDRLLDALSDPVSQIVFCDLDPRTRTTTLRRLDRSEFENWRKLYMGFGSMRAAGLDGIVAESPGSK